MTRLPGRQDENMLVLDKPAGLAVQGGQRNALHLDGMLHCLADADAAGRPLLVHRLDRDTSGCLIVARTHHAASELARAFKVPPSRRLGIVREGPCQRVTLRAPGCRTVGCKRFTTLSWPRRRGRRRGLCRFHLSRSGVRVTWRARKSVTTNPGFCCPQRRTANSQHE